MVPGKMLFTDENCKFILCSFCTDELLIEIDGLFNTIHQRNGQQFMEYENSAGSVVLVKVIEDNSYLKSPFPGDVKNSSMLVFFKPSAVSLRNTFTGK